MSAINFKHLQKFFEANSAALEEFLNCYINSAMELITSMQNALDAKDIDKINFCLHKLKGSSANSGFKKITSLCEEAEDEMQKNNWNRMYIIHQELKTLITKLQKEVSNINK